MGGSPKVVVTTGHDLPDLDWPGELTQLTSAWPCLGPAWLRATQKALPRMRPWHTIATRARGELALTAGYILDGPAGLTAPGAAGLGLLFPALLLGSPLGYRTEVAYNFWTPTLMAEITRELVPAAFDAGVRRIVAPWIPDRLGNQALVDALVHAGGHSSAWGYEDVMPIGPQTDAGALPPSNDGIVIEHVDKGAIEPYIATMAGLACLSAGEISSGEEPARVASLLTGLLGGIADVSAYLGRDNGTLAASCVTIVKDHRLFVSLAGFDGAAADGNGRACFAAMLGELARDASALGLRAIEFGTGSHVARVLSGCERRAMTSVTVMPGQTTRTVDSRQEGSSQP